MLLLKWKNHHLLNQILVNIISYLCYISWLTVAIATVNLLLQLACGTGTGSREHAMEVIREMKFLDISEASETY